MFKFYPSFVLSFPLLRLAIDLSYSTMEDLAQNNCINLLTYAAIVNAVRVDGMESASPCLGTPRQLLI